MIQQFSAARAKSGRICHTPRYNTRHGDNPFVSPTPSKPTQVKVVPRILLLCSLLSLLAFTGCGDSPDSLMAESIKVLNETADAAEAGKEPSADLKARMESLDKRMKALNLTADQKKKLEEKWKPEAEKAVQRLMGAAFKKGFGDAFKGMPPAPANP